MINPLLSFLRQLPACGAAARLRLLLATLATALLAGLNLPEAFAQAGPGAPAAPPPAAVIAPIATPPPAPPGGDQKSQKAAQLGAASNQISTPPPGGGAVVSASAASSVPGAISWAARAKALGVFFLFIAVAAAISARKLPAMVALPLMAFGICVICGAPAFKSADGVPGYLDTVLEGNTDWRTAAPSGAFMLYTAIVYTLLGGMFGRFITDSKIAERIVKSTAEYGGENPFFISLLMAAISILIFTAGGGLPTIIMLGTVMFPILLSLGVNPVVCGCLLMLTFPIGVCLQPAEWSGAASKYDIPLATSQKFFLIWAAVQFVVLILFLSIEFMRMKRTTVTRRSVLVSIGIMLMLVAGLALLFGGEHLAPDSQWATWLVDARKYLRGFLQAIAVIIIAAGVIDCQWQYWTKGKCTRPWNLLTPLLPVVLLLLLNFEKAIAPAFMAALTYAFLTTPQARGLQRLGKSIIDGVADVGAPVVLMMGIGMLITAARHPNVSGVFQPMLATIAPQTAWGFVVFFLLAAPLVLYRGPLNEFGLGVGVASMLQQLIGKPAVMGAMRSVNMLQDPTTTQNVWICGYLKLDINSLLFKLLAYSIAMVVLGLLISAAMFYPNGATQLFGATIGRLVGN